MKLTNNKIYNLAQQLTTVFQNGEQKLPIKLSFCIQKNKQTLLSLAQDIEQSRMEIVRNYGTLNQETNQYYFEPDKTIQVQNEMQDLFDIEQDVNICMINADILNSDIELSMSQVEAIMFMIEEA